MYLPKDPNILLSYINTQLRDNYDNLDDLCHNFSTTPEEIIEKLSSIHYTYDKSHNQFTMKVPASTQSMGKLACPLD